MWLLALRLASASDIYRAENEDGSLSFTDSPDHTGYEIFSVDGPPPVVGSVSVRNFPMLDAWDPELLDASVRYGVDVNLLKAIVLAESAMNPKALSSAGAMGLMQLMPATAGDLGVSDAWDPIQNIDGGSRYIRQQLTEFGDMRRAIAAYHAGPGNVIRYGGIPPFEATRIYVDRVMKLYEYFRTVRPVVDSTYRVEIE